MKQIFLALAASLIETAVLAGTIAFDQAVGAANIVEVKGAAE